MKTGQIPAEGVIRANAGGRDEPLEVPSRSATCACLGLLASLTHDADANNPSDGSRTRRAAAQAAHWLSTQQTASGGWLVTEPPDARPGEGTRLVRLDDPGYRDAFIALHLAAHVLEDERLARQAAATEEDLDALRIGDAHSVGYRLWSTAYTPDHEMVTTTPALSPAADTVASRNAMQALLAACLLGDADTAAPILQEAAASVAKLPKENGAWRRRYPLRDNAAPPPAEGATDPAPEPADAAAATGVEEVLRAAGRLDELKPKRFREAMETTLSVQDRLALTLCGLGDAFLTEESPPPGPAGAADDFELTLRRTALLAWRVKEN
jgi:hypothetical protein